MEPKVPGGGFKGGHPPLVPKKKIKTKKIIYILVNNNKGRSRTDLGSDP